jgi:peptidoglycan/xylan/chitin deacetylase (PgdA/CDA1 family)
MRASLRLMIVLVAACGSSQSGGPPPAATGGSVGTGGGPGTGGSSATGGAVAATDGPVPSPSDAAPVSADGPLVVGDGSAPQDAASPVTSDAAAPPSTGVFKVEGVATWRGNATAAYSIIHDDVCDSSARGVFSRAEVELTKRGLHAGFGLIAGECDMENGWAKVKTMVSHGHDVFSHSWTHACLGTAAECTDQKASSNFAQEIDRAGKAILDNAGVTAQYYIFPFDVCGTAAVAYLQKAGYLGARCGDHGFNAPGFPASDDFANKYDVWGPDFSVYFDKGPCAGVAKHDQDVVPNTLPLACRLYSLDQYVDDTIAGKGWGIKEFHGFDEDITEGAFQPLTPSDYTTHLDHLQPKIASNDLWVEGPTPVLRYRWAREACAPPAVNGSVLKFAAPSADCTKFATTLSFLVSTTDGSDPATVQVKQGAAMLPAKKLGPGKFVLDANPTKGDAMILIGQ